MKLLRAKTAAQLLGISKSTFYSWVQEGRIKIRPIHLSSRVTVYKESELLTWIQSQ